jgi:hypothetical protein
MTLNTSKTRSQPDAEDWQEIKEFQQLPILPSTRKAFQQVMRKTSLSFDSLAKIAEQDPALCLHMLLHINQLSPSSLEQIHSAAGCIALLGMEEVVKLVKHLPSLKPQPKNHSQRNYIQMLHTAVLAGQIAARWAQFKPGLNQHQAQWAAMLASAPLWPWQLKQVEASQTSLNQLSQGKDIIPALQAGFGALTKSHLMQWRKLSHALALPNVGQSLWQPQCWPKAQEWAVLRQQKLTSIEGHRALKLQCQQPELLIYFANALACHYRIGAYRPKSKRWLHLCANFLNQEADKVHREVVQLILQLASQERSITAVNSLLAPTLSAIPTSLVFHCEKSLTEFKMERDPPKASHGPPSERRINQTLLDKLTQQLIEEPDSFGDWHYLMRSVLKGITEGVGLKHAYIMVQNSLGNAAKVYYQQGLAETDPLCQFSIELDKASIFTKMLEKPASLMITDKNRDKMLRGISASQLKVLPQQFMMMSLFSNQRPVGIIFADLGSAKHNSSMKPSEYIAFKTLCMAASKSLTKLAHTARKKSLSNQTKENQPRT